MPGSRGPFPTLVPGQALEAHKFNNAFRSLRDVVQVSGINSLASSGIGGIAISTPGRKRIVPPRAGRAVAIARLVGLVSNASGFNYAFAGLIIGSMAGAVPAGAVVEKIFAHWWPRTSDLTIAAPVIPFGFVDISDVPVERLPIEPGRDPDNPDDATAWFVKGLFVNGCVQLG